MMRTKSLCTLFLAALLGTTALSAAADSPLSSGVPATLALPPNNLVLNAFIDVDASAKRLQFTINGNGGDLDLFVRYGTPFPTTGLSEDVINRYAHYHSVSSSTNESLLVLPSSRMPLQAGRWYVTIVNACNPNDPNAAASCVATPTASGTLTATASATSQLGTIHLDFGNPSTDTHAPCDDSFWTDPTPATPIGGNTATTLGAQRQNALSHASTELVNQLQIPVDITVHACGAHLGGDMNSAILAHAAPLTYLFDDPDFPINALPKKYTWYSITSAVRLGGTSSCGLGGGSCSGVANEELEAVFNEDIGSPNIVGGEKFYLGFDPAPNPGHTLDFVTIAMHEMTHGLGFFGLVNLDATQGPIGAKAGISGNSIAFTNLSLGPYDDIYDDYVAIVNGSTYTPFMGYEVNGANDAARAAAVVSGGVVSEDGQVDSSTQTGLRWSDSVAANSSVNINVGKAAPDDFPSLYAPCDKTASANCSPQPSSTLSHTVQPGDMMNAFYSGFNLRSMGLAVPMLSPLGWSNANATPPSFGHTIPSNWFDSTHSGHGFDFQIVLRDQTGAGHDVYLLTFYTYDATGKPEWYQAQGSFVDGVFLPDLQSNGQTLYRLVYDTTGPGQITAHADAVSGSVIVDFNQAAQAPACRNVDRSGAPLLGVMSWKIGADSAQWCVQPIVTLEQHASPDLNGHWYVPTDGGWGFELLDVQNGSGAPVVVVYVYFPGANGQPTWATASGSLNLAGTTTLDLLAVSNGYCRTCTPPSQLSGASIGSITLSQFVTNLPSGRPTGVVSINASYPGGSFARSNEAIVQLSVPNGAP